MLTPALIYTSSGGEGGIINYATR